MFSIPLLDSDNSSLSDDNIGGVSNIPGNIESDDEDLDSDDAEPFTSEPSALSEVEEEPSMEESSTDTESEAEDDAVGTRCVWAILFRFDSVIV